MSNLEFQKMYGHKIVDLKTLADRFPLDRREARIVLCHGVFDIVHPGHVRHLVYAKSKADILVVSLTADGFISKGHYRPQISQQIRALNLAAFEMVDWVIIDRNPTPIEIIQRLQPDFLAKGFEYGELTNPATSV
jgi:cytidyltransferase-like protein